MAETAIDTPPAPVAPAPTGTGDLKADKTLERYKTIPDAAKALIEANKVMGSAVRLPGKDAKPDEIAKAKTETLGKLRAAGLLESIPETPDNYEFELPAWASVDGAWNKESEAKFRATMHAAGATPSAVQAAVATYVEMIESQTANERAHREQVQGELQKEWGPNYKPNVGIANKAVQAIDDEIGAKGEFIGLLQTYGLADHPLMVKGMAWLGRSMWEHDMITAAGPTGVSAEDAQAKMDAMIKDKTHPFNNPRHPDYEAAADEFVALQRIIGRSRR